MCFVSSCFFSCSIHRHGTCSKFFFCCSSFLFFSFFFSLRIFQSHHKIGDDGPVRLTFTPAKQKRPLSPAPSISSLGNRGVSSCTVCFCCCHSIHLISHQRSIHPDSDLIIWCLQSIVQDLLLQVLLSFFHF